MTLATNYKIPFLLNYLRYVKVGFYLKAVFPSRNLGLMRISRSRFKQSKLCSFISRIYVLQSFGNFWVILGDIWEEIVFLNGLVKFREIKNGEDLM